MKKTLKWVFIVFGGGLLLLLGFIFYVFSTFGFTDGKLYSTQDLINNYKQKSKQIIALKAFINQNVSANKVVDIEFDGDKKLSIFHVADNGNYNSNWDLELDSQKTDTLLEKLSWKKETLKALKGKLDAANCISVSNGEPCIIGFQRSGMGKYYYEIFDKSIPDSLKSRYNDSCTYILYTDKVVLKYGGGAIGSQCFPKK